MVAQAHSIVSHQTEPTIQNQPIGKLTDHDKAQLRVMRPPPAPRPPDRPRLGERNISLRKPLTNPRIPNRVGGASNNNFYSSLMYDSNTGAIKPFDSERRPLKAMPGEIKEPSKSGEVRQPAWK
uniref:Uncharacterized protein n=1 Tax=Ciona savignyi TaxID=51511 RepID=H2ZF20_CIOSA